MDPQLQTGAARAAREARFERLFALARDPLSRYLARRAEPDAVEDLFAEVMTVAWRRIGDIPAGAELPWLYGVGRRVLANHRRSGSRLGRLVERLTLLEPRREMPRLIAGTPLDEDLAAAFARLPSSDAEVLRLWAWEELTPTEIGQSLGISANAASIRLHRAKGRLREAMDAPGAPAERGKVGPFAGHQPAVERKEAP